MQATKHALVPVLRGVKRKRVRVPVNRFAVSRNNNPHKKSSNFCSYFPVLFLAHHTSPFGAAERGKERDVGDGAAKAGGERGGGAAGPHGTFSSRALSRGRSNGGGGRRR